MPEDYVPALESSVADLANIEAGSTYGAGSITAALFLREFTGGRPWAHLDIAGSAAAPPTRASSPRGPPASGCACCWSGCPGASRAGRSRRGPSRGA
nr:hypothetical protein GCM10020093_060170 [Planobispora longispora]